MQLVVCSGSFDPVHNGHLDVIARAAKMYGAVLVAVAHNSAKEYSFSADERVAMVSEACESFTGVDVELMPNMLIAEYARSKGAGAIVRGVRNFLDWQYESQMALMNRHLSGVETVFLASDPRYLQLSSSLIREVGRYGGDLSAYVPDSVQRRYRAGVSGWGGEYISEENKHE